MEFDEVLDHVGDIGVYQVTLFLMLGAFEFMTADVVAMNFIGGYQDHWCTVPNLGNFSFEQQKYISVPAEENDDGKLEYDSCKLFPLDWDSYTDNDFINWNRSVMTDSIPAGDWIDCDNAWTFDQSELVSTIRSDFNLVCSDSWQGEFVSSIYMIGILVGAMAGGLASDKFGRKWAFVGSLGIKFVGNIMSTVAGNYWVFLTGRFITGAGGMGSGVSVYVLICEFTLSKYRCILGVLWFTIWSLTYALMPWIAYFLRDWVPLMGVYTWPLVVLFLYIGFIDESPRWLISQGRLDDATKVIERMAAINGAPMPENMELSGGPAPKGIEEDKKEEDAGNRRGSFLDLFRTPNLRKKTLIIYLVWFTNNLVYYGVSLNSGALAGDIYLNTFLLGVVEIPANILCFLFSNWVGRTWTIGISLVMAGACSLIQIPLIFQEGSGYEDAVTALSILGKGAVTCSFSGVYVLTSEIFPTGIRNVGLGSASMCARISGIIAPFMGAPLINVWPALPSLIFGTFSLGSGLCTLLLPETLNTALPETIEQAEAFGKKSSAVGPTVDPAEEKIALETNGNVVVDANDNEGYVPDNKEEEEEKAEQRTSTTQL